MPAVCCYFQVHQPYRLRGYRVQDIGVNHGYFDPENRRILEKVAAKCYQPATQLLLDIARSEPRFRCAFSFSGVVLEQLETWAPETLTTFQRLVGTGRVEVLAETYYHSLASLYDPGEFSNQIQAHADTVRRLFGVTPTMFRNTELIYSDAIADAVAKAGYLGMLTEGADQALGDRSPNFVYRSTSSKPLLVLLKNYQLSDDIAFRFSSRTWDHYPLTSEKFAHWVGQVNGSGQLINLFMDYETFGEHQWADTGIFAFLKALPRALLAQPDTEFVTPAQAVTRFDPVGVFASEQPISWADTERDLSAWRSNELQTAALEAVYALRQAVLSATDPQLIDTWRRLQTSDHFYYMCTKWFADGDVHKYFNPFGSPYDAYIAFMNVLADLEVQLPYGESVTASATSVVQ